MNMVKRIEEREELSPGLDDLTGALSPDDFKAAFRNHPAGVAVITADDGAGPVAMTVTSVFSVSAVPPLLVFSASELSSSTPTIERAETLVVHLLGADRLELAKLAATSGVDRFGPGIAWDRLPTGEPYYTEVATWIRGRIVNRLRAGASTLFVVEALQARSPAAGSVDADAASAHPLVYHNRTWHVLGEHSRA